jgi:RES domain-containing protein
VIYPPEVLDCLQAVEPQAWAGTVFRHMWGSYPPDRENTQGGRWNPRDVAAIYTSCDRSGVLAEAEHQIAMQPVRPRARRTIYEVRIALTATLDLTELDLLEELGIGNDELGAPDMRACQQVGGAAAWLEADGILVPSARSSSTNLVIFPTNSRLDAAFEVVSQDEITAR